MRLLKIVALLIVLGAAGVWAANRFLAPESDVLIRAQATGGAQEKILNGEFEAALTDIENGLIELPGDWELMVWRSVLLDKLSESGADSMAQAVATGTQPDVWIVQAMAALLVEEPEIALEAGAQIIEHSPDMPQGYFLAAQSHEQMGQIANALQFYEQAADIAENNPDYYGIYVASRERIGMLSLNPTPQS